MPSLGQISFYCSLNILIVTVSDEHIDNDDIVHDTKCRMCSRSITLHTHQNTVSYMNIQI